jgi:V8-like Glu-specific endopeptidase
MKNVEPVIETEPMTGLVNQPIRHGTLDGDGHPGVLRLHIRVGASGFLCSGTVIEQRTILTAAHCVENAASASDVFVVLGDEYRAASQMWIHEEYSANTPHLRSVDGQVYRFSGPDIAIIAFAQDLPAPVVTIGTDAPTQGDLVTIVGFGNDENESKGVRRVGQVEFQSMTPTYLEDKQTVDHNTGALVVNPGPNNELVCGGDSGGALLVGDTLVGVTSGGVVAVGDDNPCVRSRNANFISAAAYLDWIETHVTLPRNEEAPIADELLCAAHQLDTTNGFAPTTSYAHNWGGLGEKWIRDSRGQWHYILPEGTVYQWNVGTTPPTGTLVSTLSPTFHADPSHLTEAPEPNVECQQQDVDTDVLNQNAYDLDQLYEFRFNGSYATNWGGLGEKWITGGNNRWFYILPNGQLNRWTNSTRPLVGEVIGQFSPEYHGDPAKLHEAPNPEANVANCDQDTIESNAYALDQEYGFRFTGSYAENWGGHGEKWFQNSNGRWFFITPDGNLYRWTRNTHPAEGTLVDTLSEAYHADPMLLIEAFEPAADECDGDDGTDLSAEAASLDAQFGFTSDGSYNQDWGGLNEKWFSNVSNNWFYILPNGEIYRWQMGTRPLEGTLVGQLDSTFHENPALLHDAAE